MSYTIGLYSNTGSSTSNLESISAIDGYFSDLFCADLYAGNIHSGSDDFSDIVCNTIVCSTDATTQYLFCSSDCNIQNNCFVGETLICNQITSNDSTNINVTGTNWSEFSSLSSALIYNRTQLQFDGTITWITSDSTKNWQTSVSGSDVLFSCTNWPTNLNGCKISNQTTIPLLYTGSGTESNQGPNYPWAIPWTSSYNDFPSGFNPSSNLSRFYNLSSTTAIFRVDLNVNAELTLVTPITYAQSLEISCTVSGSTPSIYTFRSIGNNVPYVSVSADVIIPAGQYMTLNVSMNDVVVGHLYTYTAYCNIRLITNALYSQV